MPRQRFSKPWFHQSSGYWCTSVNGKRSYLDKDYTVACRKLKQLRADQLGGKPVGPDWIDAPFADLADEFLEDTKARRKPSTYAVYRYRLLRALKILGTAIRVGEIRKFHLAKIERELAGSLRSNTIKDTIATVQTVFSWAVKHDMLADNPLVGYQKPRGGRHPDHCQCVSRCEAPPGCNQWPRFPSQPASVGRGRPTLNRFCPFLSRRRRAGPNNSGILL